MFKIKKGHKKSMIKKYYRVFEDRKGMPATIFHGVRKSRLLPLNTYIKAEVKDVLDGSGFKSYKSGFHVLKNIELVKNYFVKVFKDFRNRVICEVYIDESKGIWKKPTNDYVFLAKSMKITKKQWANRIPLKG